ncbi:Deoxyhypusine hydroxylase [Chaetomidium leptoderma]|uniref:Deoxyhypusine hydroxylase n=1 Tax=Chaetomidium leptoderma TaxID=669021 RepID=A0AAN6ZVJ3_9PEZI|nr:Deoxyhypusine hydroxylase [Chaetomidium leptoderma]
MGIPQFRKHLEPYAERAAIEPGSAVLDGPALAYHVLNLCSRATRKTCPFEQPSNELLGKTAIAWLQQIQACGLSISAIYFDGYLPGSKRPERIQRLFKSSRDLIKYHSTFPAGVPRANPQHAGDAHVDLFPDTWLMEKKAKPPPPPFLVPAVIDALRDSSEFGALVKLVPGEADGFCAQHVRQNGGTVLTSDSDLLVYGLGEEGGVVFFADIDVDTETHRLIAPQYRPADVCRRLSITPETGLQYLAFEISRDPHLTLEQAVERCKRSEAVSSREEYSEFIDQYLAPEVASNFETDQVPPLDPRVSEIVLRSLRLPGATNPVQPDKPAPQDRNCSELEMYLPLLLDYPSRTSAWEASKHVRQLAYAVLQSIRGSSIPSVLEMRRLQTMSSGSHVDVPEAVEIDGLGASLLALVSQIEASLNQPDLVWAVLAVYHDIVMTVDRGKGYPLSLEVLRQESRGKLDPCSWDFLHFLGETQATYYSLRMLRQILEFSAHHTGTMSTTMSALSTLLTRLPALPSFPSPRTFAKTISLFREAGGLACLQSLCTDYEDIIPLIKSIQQPQNSKKNVSVVGERSSEGDDAPSPLTTIASLRQSLTTETTPLPVRFRALFSLKHLARQHPPASAESLAALAAIAAAFTSPSALLKHELAYCLGQTGNGAAIPYLTAVLEDVGEDAMCRHEAAEALGALGNAECLAVLRRFRDRVGEEVVVTETCEIAIDRIEWENGEGRKGERLRASDFASVDPAPPTAQGQEEQTVEELGKTLMDTSVPLFKRYRAMFALRDLASPPDLPTAVPAVLALAKGFADSSALFRHEIAFVFGQLAHPASIPALTAALSDTEEASMVRHEAAEALGSLGDEEGVEATLLKFLHDKEAVVRESVIVALDMAEYEKSNETEYALIPEAKGTA